jgi:hypothetical protein
LTRARAAGALLLGGCGSALVDLRDKTPGGDSAVIPGDTGDISTEYQQNTVTILGERTNQHVGSGGFDLHVGPMGRTLVVAAPDSSAGDGAVALIPLPQDSESLSFGAGQAELLGPSGGGLGQALALEANGDGGLLAVGAPGVETAYLLFTEAAQGRVSVGEVAHSRLTSDREAGRFGAALALGDVDGDGLTDAIVGAPEETYAAGRVYLFSGADSQLRWEAEDATATVLGTTSYDTLGSAVSAAADFDGDGVLDLVLCMPDFDGSGRDVGGCAVALGGIDVLSRGWSLWDEVVALVYGAQSEDRLGDGPHTLWVGDLTGDDRADLAIGLPGSELDERPEGAVALFDGTELTGSRSSDEARLRVAGLGGLGLSVGGNRAMSELLMATPSGDGRGGGAITAVPAQTTGRVDLRGLAPLVEAEQASDQLGIGGILGGNLFGDGGQHLIFALPGSDGEAPGAGQVRVRPRP